ncbi:MAG: citrate lyase acyl carrier protein [Deltaproteobacteria bacterium]|jgi:citrate lyase subunit gamma (acyl carrier protein)|nr:citrate lyase acyl carrier protein [Deltaproteobacteria bacterium]
MEIARTASAGSLESSDVLVYVRAAGEPGVSIEITSIVMERFGDQIKACVEEMIEKFQVRRGVFQINDRGALDYTIKARVETAILRAAGEDKA